MDNPPTRHPPASLPSASPIIGCSLASWSRAFLPAGWPRHQSVCCSGPMGIQAIQERVGYIPAGSSSSWGGGVLVHATHSVNQRTWRGKGKSPGPPTHNCLWTRHYSLPLFSCWRATHKHARTTHCLIHLIRYIQGLCIQVSRFSFIFQSHPVWVKQKSHLVTFLRRLRAGSLHTRNMGGCGGTVVAHA